MVPFSNASGAHENRIGCTPKLYVIRCSTGSCDFE